MKVANVTVRLETPKDARRILRCPFGCEYSADAGDYWDRAGNSPMTCTHDDENYPCELAERVHVYGEDDKGRWFTASGWATIKEGATVGDLRAN